LPAAGGVVSREAVGAAAEQSEPLLLQQSEPLLLQQSEPLLLQQSEPLLLHTDMIPMAWAFPLDGAPSAFAAEPWGSQAISVAGGNLTLQGSNRLYLIRGAPDGGRRPWSALTYRRFHLRGKRLRFTVDVSRVPCGCNAAVYLVAMPQGGGTDAGYCDIVTAPWCTEVDLLEANSHALNAAIHTRQGHGASGWCNSDGCAYNVGQAGGGRFGAGGLIDTRRPFTVRATFPAEGGLTVSLSQGESNLPTLDSSLHGNTPHGPHPVRAADLHSLGEAIDAGLVLVTSLWTDSSGSMAWLNGQCRERCDLSTASFQLGQIEVVRLRPLPAAPPPPPPPPGPQPSPPPSPPALETSPQSPSHVRAPEALTSPTSPAPLILRTLFGVVSAGATLVTLGCLLRRALRSPAQASRGRRVLEVEACAGQPVGRLQHARHDQPA